MTDGLGDVTLAGATGSDDQYGHFFFNKTACDQLVDECGVDVGIEVEVELIEGFVEPEGGPPQAGGKEETPDTDKVSPSGLPRQSSTLPRKMVSHQR